MLGSSQILVTLNNVFRKSNLYRCKIYLALPVCEWVLFNDPQKEGGTS